MAILFESLAPPGRVIRLSNGDAGRIMNPDDWSDFGIIPAIFTTVNVGHGINFQAQSTLGDNIYLNVFGNRPSNMTVSGLAFMNSCSQNRTEGSPANSYNGLERIQDFFGRNNIRNRSTPIQITLAPSVTYNCYLHSWQADMVGEMATASQIYQFSMALLVTPPADPSLPSA